MRINNNTARESIESKKVLLTPIFPLITWKIKIPFFYLSKDDLILYVTSIFPNSNNHSAKIVFSARTSSLNQVIWS